MKTFFIADTHFGHDAIRRHCDRPFASVSEMDKVMVSNWNAKVGPKDTVYHLGDFSYRANDSIESYVHQLNGTIHLVKGNHDPDDLTRLQGVFASVSDIANIKVEGQRIILCHYAMRVWDRSHHGAWHLYGHSHGTLEELEDNLSFDVGVDCHHFSPIEFNEVKSYIELKMALANSSRQTPPDTPTTQ